MGEVRQMNVYSLERDKGCMHMGGRRRHRGTLS